MASLCGIWWRGLPGAILLTASGSSILWSGESQESDPSVESCFVKFRWKEAVIILCFFPFLLSHEVFQQLLLRNKYKATPTGGGGLSEVLATQTQCLQTFPGILVHLKIITRKLTACSVRGFTDTLLIFTFQVLRVIPLHQFLGLLPNSAGTATVGVKLDGSLHL